MLVVKVLLAGAWWKKPFYATVASITEAVAKYGPNATILVNNGVKWVPAY